MSAVAQPAAPHRVVVVDDTPDLRELLRLALERAGDFQVVGEAGNGREAVEVVRQLRPDVVLLDIAMPVMDGLEALPLVREVCPAATVVMLSGFGSTEMTTRAIEGGAHGYIQKGQSLKSTIAQIRTFAAREDVPDPCPLAARKAPPRIVPVADHLELAPFGFVHVRENRVVRANREACRLLGDLTTAADALSVVAPPLAEMILDRRDQDTSGLLDLGNPTRRILVTVRHRGPDSLAYLQTEASDEAALLRRAIATAAHEIRNPVGVLSGVAETLALHEADITEDERARMLAAIARQTRLLDGITGDLLASGQALHGTLSVQPERVDPGQVVRSAIPDGLDVTVVEDTTAEVHADPLRLQQILGNLLTNAAKYGDPPVLVRVYSVGAEVKIAVEDSGPGVPEGFRPRLFQEYSRAPGTTARGTGLGLFVVRVLAEAHGGTVEYAPRTPHGSVFTVSLPGLQD